MLLASEKPSTKVNERISYLLDHFSPSPNVQDIHGLTVIHHLASSKLSDTEQADLVTTAKLLLNGGADLNMKDYAKAIEYLNEFSSEDDVLGPISRGGIGDAFVQLEQLEDAFDYYIQAADLRTNNYTTPMYLLKAGVIGLKIGEFDKSLLYFNKIKSDFPESTEAKDIDVFIGKAEALN